MTRLIFFPVFIPLIYIVEGFLHKTKHTMTIHERAVRMGRLFLFRRSAKYSVLLQSHLLIEIPFRVVAVDDDLLRADDERPLVGFRVEREDEMRRRGLGESRSDERHSPRALLELADVHPHLIVLFDVEDAAEDDALVLVYPDDDR